MKKEERDIKVGRHIVTLTHESKILFPKSKISKKELIQYYHDIAPTMLPYTKDRPISMRRFVNGIGKEGFYQKDAGSYFPSWIKTKKIKKEDGFVNYVVINNAATLVYLANQISIENHIWLSRIDRLHYPDRMIFDLDPSKGLGFDAVRWAANTIKAVLDDELYLPNFLMTTGSRGVHVVVPLKRSHTFDFTRAFAHDVARLLASRYPKKLTIEMRLEKRGKRIFVDWLRNAFGQTGVSPYSVRAKEGAPVATPIEWNELSRVESQSFNIKNIFKRLSRKKDPWKLINKKACSLTKARKKLTVLLSEVEI